MDILEEDFGPALEDYLWRKFPNLHKWERDSIKADIMNLAQPINYLIEEIDNEASSRGYEQGYDEGRYHSDNEIEDLMDEIQDLKDQIAELER